MTDTNGRTAGLKQILVEYRRATLDGVQSRIRDSRASRLAEVRDDLEQSDGDIQGDIELALLQMRAETLTRIDEAIHRLAEGTYGVCAECEVDISEGRLRALPFAVRCQACEATCEQRLLHSRARAQQAASVWSFREFAGFGTRRLDRQAT